MCGVCSYGTFCVSPPSAFSAAHLEAEFIVFGGGKAAEKAVKPLKEKGSHVELVSSRPTAMHTLREAFSLAHFSQILVYIYYVCVVCMYEL